MMMRGILCGLFLLMAISRGDAGRLTFDSAAEWALWESRSG